MITSIEEFFAAIRSKGPWRISFGNPSPTAHVEASELKEIPAAFHAAQNSRLSVWFRLNHAAAATGDGGALVDADIIEYAGIPIDIDLPDRLLDASATDIAAWQSTMLEILKLGSIVPPPTIITCSGGGVQAFLLFDAPTVMAPEQYRAIVKGIAASLIAAGLDTTDTAIHNPSRLMRIPFGFNYKRELGGRFPPASILYADGPRYAADSFSVAFPIAPVPLKDAGNKFPSTLHCSPLLERLIMNGINNLPASADPEERAAQEAFYPNGSLDPSNGVQYICSHLWAMGNSREDIRSAILVKGSWTEANLVNKGKGMERQISRHLSDETLTKYYPKLQWKAEFNHKFCIVRDAGGSATVIWKKDNGLTFYSFNNFREAWMDKKTPDGKPAAEAWLKDPLTLRYQGITNSMDRRNQDGLFNVMPSYPYPPRKGDCSLYFDHILQNVCRDNTEYFDWILDWMAYGIRIDGPMNSAIVTYGAEGTGKNVFFDHYAALFPGGGTVLSTPGSIDDDFNEWQIRGGALLLNEAMFVRNRKSVNTVKAWITDKTLSVRSMRRDRFSVGNNLRIFIAGNDDEIIDAGGGGRRYMVLKMGEGRICDTKYFLDMKHQMEHGGYEALTYELLHRGIAGFVPSDVPKTEMLNDQMKYSHEDKLRRDPALDTVERFLADGTVPSAVADGDDGIKFNMLNVMSSVNKFINHRALGRQLKKLAGAWTAKSNGKWTWHMPGLEECRKVYREKMGIKDTDDMVGASSPAALWHISTHSTWQDQSDNDTLL
jgi:hypothetical protein